MDEAQRLFDEGMSLMEQGNLSEAMDRFTKSYNTGWNTRALFYSAESAFQLAMSYFKQKVYVDWDIFSNDALFKFRRCLDETPSDEIKMKATDRINKINELRELAKDMK